MDHPNNVRHWLGVTAILVSIFSIFGCAGKFAHPLGARPGDTITLAVGSAEGMTTTNTQVSLTPNGGTAIPLTIRNIFKLYPDKKSPAWLKNGNTRAIEEQTGHGPWTSIIAIDLPLTYPDGFTPIEIGPGIINITSSATYSPLTTHINNVPIGLEILADTGVKNFFEYELLNGVTDSDRLGDLEPLGGITVKPTYTGTTTGTTYGAIEIAVTIPNSTNITDIDVILDEKVGHSTSRRAQYFWKKSGETITVSIINPDGLLEYWDASFSVVSSAIQALVDNDLAIPDSHPSLPATITTNTTYYNVNGQVDAGPSLLSFDET